MSVRVDAAAGAVPHHKPLVRVAVERRWSAQPALVSRKQRPPLRKAERSLVRREGGGLSQSGAKTGRQAVRDGGRNAAARTGIDARFVRQAVDASCFADDLPDDAVEHAHADDTAVWVGIATGGAVTLRVERRDGSLRVDVTHRQHDGDCATVSRVFDKRSELSETTVSRRPRAPDDGDRPEPNTVRFPASVQ